MSFWGVMNSIAWGLCVLITVVFIVDFIRIEKGRLKND